MAGSDRLRLAGNRVLITQVTGFVGLRAARACAAEGARVLCTDRGFADAATRAAFTRDEPPLSALAAQTPEELAREAGDVDAVILNDDHPAMRAPVGPDAVGELRAALEALCVEPFARVAHLVAPLRRRGGGRIVVVSSAAPLRGIPNYAAYVTARGAANAMVKTLAVELGREGISVVGFAPNFVASPTYFPPELLDDPAKRAKIEANIPLGRIASPEEAGAVLAFLASPAADFLSGAVIPFAGGWA